MPRQRTPPTNHGNSAPVVRAARLIILTLLIGGLALKATEQGRTFSGFLGN